MEASAKSTLLPNAVRDAAFQMARARLRLLPDVPGTRTWVPDKPWFALYFQASNPVFCLCCRPTSREAHHPQLLESPLTRPDLLLRMRGG